MLDKTSFILGTIVGLVGMNLLMIFLSVLGEIERKTRNHKTNSQTKN